MGRERWGIDRHTPPRRERGAIPALARRDTNEVNDTAWRAVVTTDAAWRRVREGSGRKNGGQVSDSILKDNSTSYKGHSGLVESRNVLRATVGTAR